MRVSTRHDTTVVVVGDSRVGKTALVNKFRAGRFDSSYARTHFDSVTTSSIVQGQRVKFTIYDTSGTRSVGNHGQSCAAQSAAAISSGSWPICHQYSCVVPSYGRCV